MANPNIGKHGIRFSADHQPKNRRKSNKFLSELLRKDLNKKTEVLITGIDITTGKETTVKVVAPSREVIVTALLTKAASGDISAIREIFDRVEGKPIFTAEVDLPGISMIGFKEVD